MNAKKLAKGITVIALIAIIAVGATLAYLSAVTDTKTNKFSSSQGITGELTEKKWTYGDEGWTDYKPGDSTGKNPVVELKSEDGKDLYAAVGMNVLCKDADGNKISMADFEANYATVSTDNVDDNNDGINDHWVHKGYTTDKGDFYYYYTTVNTNPSFTTESIFDKVTVNTGIKTVYYASTEQETVKVYNTDANGNKVGDAVKTTTGASVIVDSGQRAYIVDAQGNETLVDNSKVKLPNFTIVATGYAVQSTVQAVGTPSTDDIDNLMALVK